MTSHCGLVVIAPTRYARTLRLDHIMRPEMSTVRQPSANVYECTQYGNERLRDGDGGGTCKLRLVNSGGKSRVREATISPPAALPT